MTVHIYDKEHKHCPICEQLRAMTGMSAPSIAKPLQDEMDKNFLEAVHGVKIIIPTVLDLLRRKRSE